LSGETYQVRFTGSARDSLSRLDKTVAQRIFKKIRWLAKNYELLSPEPLTGEWQEMYKLRAGEYRVIYTVEKAGKKIITVHLVGHRREIYKPK